jgi:Aldose 1-epimerase
LGLTACTVIQHRSKPISGGIPHCFPQFGPGEMQQHGFARNLDWTISSTSADLQPDDRDPQVLSLQCRINTFLYSWGDGARPRRWEQSQVIWALEAQELHGAGPCR